MNCLLEYNPAIAMYANLLYVIKNLQEYMPGCSQVGYEMKKQCFFKSFNFVQLHFLFQCDQLIFFNEINFKMKQNYYETETYSCHIFNLKLPCFYKKFVLLPLQITLVKCLWN